MAVLASAGKAGEAVQVYGLLVGAAVALPGAMVYCFGAIVGHRIAIRKTAERQLAIFEQRLGQQKA